MQITSLFQQSATEAYDELKAAQIAAFFALRQGGSIGVLKLAKLMYLAERRSLERYASLLTWDRLCSMEHGPALLQSFDRMCGEEDPHRAWSELFDQRDGNTLRLARADLGQDALGRLSDADVDLLDEIWRSFGQMSTHQLRVYTNEALPEYENPGKASRPVDMELLLGSIGYSATQVEEILGQIEEHNAYRAAMNKAAL